MASHPEDAPSGYVDNIAREICDQVRIERKISEHLPPWIRAAIERAAVVGFLRGLSHTEGRDEGFYLTGLEKAQALIEEETAKIYARIEAETALKGARNE